MLCAFIFWLNKTLTLKPTVFPVRVPSSALLLTPDCKGSSILSKPDRVAKMQACGGAAVMGSLQQPTWTKGTTFPNKRLSFGGYSHQLKLNYVKTRRLILTLKEAWLLEGHPLLSLCLCQKLEEYFWDCKGDGSSFIDNGLNVADPDVLWYYWKGEGATVQEP
ncbi:serine hydroxymethyltransferase 3 chloroplastic-like [Prunus yedoensis var. nudiflora]|uniref:Serine hydroxymethyltransferase 3 chloroplastic-like n=1 Tax=Prunus yedoensis var. nudiflora TaxID=2094558 RepID=A0A314ZMM4_PRUYE|nr:serine hydroxymethyltransferase 3 chloroplastic-like [Prunus yedoensis var. nudiflora]